jgi:hypothetical protein
MELCVLALQRRAVCSTAVTLILLWIPMPAPASLFPDPAHAAAQEPVHSTPTNTYVQGAPRPPVTVRLRRVDATYPADARTRRIEGRVLLAATIATERHPVAIESLAGPRALVRAAIAAVRQWDALGKVSLCASSSA